MSTMQPAKGGGPLFPVGDQPHRHVPKEKSRAGFSMCDLTEKCFGALTEFENAATIDTEGVEQIQP